MSPISCSFCTNPNPPEAKYCNQCGSPLGLKPCPACEAVNEVAAEQCHQCGATFELPAVEQVASPIEQSPGSEVTDGVSRQVSPAADAPDSVAEQASLTAALSVSAAPFTIDAAEAAPIHIPESFADRLERDAGPHAFERIEPRIAHVEDRDAREPISSYPSSITMRRRRRAWRAPLAVALLAAFAGAGYYAYTRDVPGLDRLAEFAVAGRNAEAPARVARQSEDAQPAATDAKGEPSAANVSANPAQGAQRGQSSTTPASAALEQSASESNPASAALVSVQPGAPGQPQANTASTQPAGSSAKPKESAPGVPPRIDDDAARQKTDTAAGRSRRQADADAIATQRLIARDLGTAMPPPANAPAAPLDRDAAETQRLIERDLGPFLHRNDRSSRGGTYPAIN